MNALAQKYRYSRSTSPFDDAKGMYIIIGICAVAVIIGLVVCLVLQRGPSDDDIPVVEQGDGNEGYIDTYPDFTGDSDDLIIDDDSTPVSEFVVAVNDADGIYLRGDEGGESRLTVSSQTSESFSFEISNDGGTVAGTAYFTGEYSAMCEASGGSLVFDFDGGAIFVSVEGGTDDTAMLQGSGLFVFAEELPTTAGTTTTTAATTTTIATTAARTGIYDLDVLYSDAVQKVLKNLLSDSEFSLMKSLLDLYPNGYGMINGNGPASMEVDGRSFNLDTELDAVMYYSSESGTGREVVVLCADGPLVYVGLCDGSDYRYFTNDPARADASSAPNTVVQYARLKSMTLING